MRFVEMTSTELSEARVLGFDLLRGLCALIVATYHMLYWTKTAHFYSWGLYGVYIFFVLSGASLVVAYRARFQHGLPLPRFIFLRYSRLFPLYFSVLLLYALYAMHGGRFDSNYAIKVLLNATFLFGLANPGDTSLVGGGWSLGIEFVFYLVFPLLLALAFSSQYRLVAMLLLVAQMTFVNLVLSGQDLMTQWVAYTQPLSFIAYFFFGCLVGRYYLEGKIRKSGLHLVGFIAFLGALLAVSGTSYTDVLVGYTGVLLTLAAIGSTYFASGLIINGTMKHVARVLGDLSYGLYLLHPVVWTVFARAFEGMNTAILIAISILASSVLALLIDRYIERPFRALAKRKTLPLAENRAPVGSPLT